MGYGYEPKVTETSTSSAQAETGSQSVGGSYTQIYGNSATQEDLGLSGSASAGGSGGEVEEASNRLQDCVRSLWDARGDGIDNAWEMASTEDAPDWTEALLASAVAAGLVAASELVTGPLVAALIAKLSSDAGAVVKGALKPILSTPVSDAAKGTVSSTLIDQRSNGASSVEAYFVGAKAGARVQCNDELAAFRQVAADLASKHPEEAAEWLLGIAQDVQARAMGAESTQSQRAIVAWMTMLAQSDTGRSAEDGGTDLSKDGSGRGFMDKVLGVAPRGVVRVHVVFDSGGSIRPKSSEVQGVSTQMLEALASSDITLQDLGLPLFVAGMLDDGVGWIECGRNEVGAVTHTSFGTGESLLEYLGGGVTTAGAAAVLAGIASKTLQDLGTKVA